MEFSECDQLPKENQRFAMEEDFVYEDLSLEDK